MVDTIPSVPHVLFCPFQTFLSIILIQFCIFIVALVGLCYKIFKDKRK
ncbi:MAG: putative holin-like toxin [Lachnospiraceae bacterium]